MNGLLDSRNIIVKKNSDDIVTTHMTIYMLDTNFDLLVGSLILVLSNDLC